MKFIYIDLILLAVFSIFVAIFLIKNRKKLIIESKIFLLYKTKVGIKFINVAAKFLSPVMPILTWVSISVGFILMITMVYLLIHLMFMVLFTPIVINTPPIIPLLPYIPQALDIGLPDFYFIHWIVAIILLATTHEAAHGIFASFYKIKIKATGFGFLGPLLAFFVEPDEKVMQKRNAKQQLSILAAGSFSNFVFAIIFILILQLFFVLVYVPAGIGNYVFMYQSLNLSEIEMIGEYSPEGFLNLSKEEMEAIEETLIVKSMERDYYIPPSLMKELVKDKKLIESTNKIIVFEDTPAFHANLSGGIQKINDYKIENIRDFIDELSKYKEGDEIKIVTTTGVYDVILIQHPEDSEKGYLGVVFPQPQSILFGLGSPFFNPYLNVETKYDENILHFIENFFVWLILIFFMIALFNMLPLGFLDGGKFLYVFALTLTKSQKKATKIFRVFSSLIILIFFAIMFVWVLNLN